MRWLIRQGNAHGEWAVLDLVRGYRVCNYNPGTHGGPHVHHPISGPDLGPAGVATQIQAERVMRWYARRHERFDLAAYGATVRTWKSGSKRS